MKYKDKLRVCGDFNGHIRCDRNSNDHVLGAFSIDDGNAWRKRVTDFSITNGMAAMNTFYKHRKPQVDLLRVE